MGKKRPLHVLKPPQAVPPSILQLNEKVKRLTKEKSSGSVGPTTHETAPPSKTEPTAPSVILRDQKAEKQIKALTDEEILRKFDVDSLYGPSIGLTRLHRLNRAIKCGLFPPEEVQSAIRNATETRSIFDQRIGNMTTVN